MKLKLDENLGHAAADLFRQAGHEVETVSSEGLSGSPDEDVIAACRREQRGLVTLDGAVVEQVNQFLATVKEGFHTQ